MSNRKFTLTPHPDFVIIEAVKVADKSDGGIVLSDEAKRNAQKRQNRGTIIWVGANVNWLKEGDFVSFYKNAATEIEVEGEDFIEINEAHILCIIEGLTTKEAIL
jgi:co-chaperonin GroES (HSP10)